jgi:hypothetical protein
MTLRIVFRAAGYDESEGSWTTLRYVSVKIGVTLEGAKI